MTEKVEFGDFQTPPHLCDQVCNLLKRNQIKPNSIIEPTCGRGNFLRSSAKAFPDCQEMLGFELNAEYAIEAAKHGSKIHCSNFFLVDWSKVIRSLPEPLLILGNPPWVTNAAIGTLCGGNLPEKSNFQKLRGVDAITGKSNFDISEWMIGSLTVLLSGRHATISMLCKTTVARKVLAKAWRENSQIANSSIWKIDARNFFGAAVDACLFVYNFKPGQRSRECAVYESMKSLHRQSFIRFYNNRLVIASDSANRHYHLMGSSSMRWRSGVKHDCSKVMELRKVGDGLLNGFGESVKIENDYLFPMLKSSDLSKSDPTPSKYMLVPQKRIGEDTQGISLKAPLTWKYLQLHSKLLDKRASTIYRKRPSFSVFGVGDYAFAPWKIAISGFYKSLAFRLIGSEGGKPVVLDDTCYFLPFNNRDDARVVLSMLSSNVATEFFMSRIFWDAKRPITAEILGSLDLAALASECGTRLPASPF